MGTSVKKSVGKNVGRKKGEAAIKILDILQTAFSPIEELFVIFTSPYGSSYSQIMRRLDQYRLARDKFFCDFHNDPQDTSRQRFHNLIYRLKKEGLITCNRDGENKKVIYLTDVGKTAIGKIKLQKTHFLPLRNYKQEKTEIVKIVVFDVPEQDRRKRDWLRGALSNLGFTMLQKSVWAGKSKIPETFLNDLRYLQILKYVEIFSISKTGTLRKIK